MLSRRVWTFVFTVMLVPVMSAAQSPSGQSSIGPGPRLVIPNLDHLAKKATESVDLSLDTSLLSLAARFLDDDDGDEESVKALIGGLKGIYVRSFEFDVDRAYAAADIEPIRKQLAGGGWTRLVGVRSQRESADVDVFIALEGNKVQGLAIVAAGARELAIINIVGAVDLDRLRKLEGQLGIPKLGIERKKDE
jgi:hypothetical protein